MWWAQAERRPTEGLDVAAPAAAYVNPDRVAQFLADLKARVGSVTVHGSISKLRRMTQLLAPDRDLAWLVDLENDLALVMQPRSKFSRLVATSVLVEAGMTLMAEAERAKHRSVLARARQFRDGLMVALLALCPIRLKNFSTLTLGRTFKRVNESWWILLSAADTKEGRADERQVPSSLTPWIDRYLEHYRPSLSRAPDNCGSVWLSSNTGEPLSYTAVELIISRTTLATTGVNVSPHLFRAAAATTAAIYGNHMPHLASALLHHTDPSVTEQHYIRASSMAAAQDYATIVKAIRSS